MGRRTQGLASQRAGLLDWLASLMGGNNVSTEVDIIPGNYNYVYGKNNASSKRHFIMRLCAQVVKPWLFWPEIPLKTSTVLPLKIAAAKALKANAKVGLASIT